MASEVDICNVALGHLGDTGNIASLYPPEGSAQAEHCARFYPMARDALLSLHTWGFATRRVPLAQLSTDVPGWAYAYVFPSDTLTVLAVQGPDEPDPEAGGFPAMSHPYVSESNEAGNRTIYCNVPNAVMRGIFRVTSTERFTPLFITTLSWQLASMLAGPVIKGDAGMTEAKRCAQMAQAYLAQATGHDANQRNVKPTFTPSGIAARGSNLNSGGLSGRSGGWRP